MKGSIKYFLLVAVAVLFLSTGYLSSQTVEGSGSHEHACSACDCAACEKGMSGEAVWCESCKVGYKDGHKVKCKSCFEGMTGKRNEWCESCNAGYLKGEKVDCKECCHAGETCKTCQNK